MPPDATTQVGARNVAEDESDATELLTPELIREVTEKVYVLMQRDLRLSRQRRGTHSAKTGRTSATNR